MPVVLCANGTYESTSFSRSIGIITMALVLDEDWIVLVARLYLNSTSLVQAFPKPTTKTKTQKLLGGGPDCSKVAS